MLSILSLNPGEISINIVDVVEYDDNDEDDDIHFFAGINKKNIMTGEIKTNPCMFWIRFVHVVVGVLLLVNAYIFWGKTGNNVGEKVVLGAVGVLGAGALAYHGYRAFIKGGYVCS